MTATTGHIWVSHTMTQPSVRAIAPAMLSHRPALSPMDLNYATRSAAFVATRDRTPFQAPMVCRWTREQVAA
jgi:hypothetical protein